MLSKEEIKKWLLENCISEMGNLDLSGLDFSDFDGNVFIDGMKVKNNLIQSNQEVGSFLYQNYQKVRGWLIQDHQEVGDDLCQGHQKASGCLYQDYQTAKKDIYQSYQKSGGSVHQTRQKAEVAILQDSQKIRGVIERAAAPNLSMSSTGSSTASLPRASSKTARNT